MRKQYRFRSADRGVLIWDVDRLVKMPKDFTRKHVRIDDIREIDETYWASNGEIDETYWASNGEITCRAVVEHAKLIQEANLSFPIILSADGRVMDGMERERGGRSCCKWSRSVKRTWDDTIAMDSVISWTFLSTGAAKRP